MFCTFLLAAATSVALVDKGYVKFHTEVAADAPLPLKYGAAELKKYLDGAEPRAGEKTLPIVIRVEKLAELKEDGFVLDVREDGVTITGSNPRGALYGCYEILKKYAGMRWLVPGQNGEYRVKDWKNVSVPVGRQVRNPHLAQRTNTAVSGLAQEWQVRNNMAGNICGVGWCFPYNESFERYCVDCNAIGGHVMTTLFVGDVPKGSSEAECSKKLLKERPDLCPLWEGKRVAMTGPYGVNPCVSNPEVLDRMAAKLIKILKLSPHSSESACILGNNDTTAWCQCDKCRAIDAPELKNTRGERSDRYWYMVNEIAKRVWKEIPDAKMGGWCYQDFWYAPAHVKPDPRLVVVISYNNQCWRHSVMDKSCPINEEMRKVYGSWKKLGMPFVFNRDEISQSGSPGQEFEPSESVVAKNFLEYRDLGCNGSSFCLYADDASYYEWTKDWKFHGRNYFWAAMWQSQYVAALMMWDPTTDWKAALEEANELYYGKTVWKYAMKNFRSLLTKCFLETKGCIGWGQGETVGACLDRPGSEAELKRLLDLGVFYAWQSGDARIIRHVEMEREIFQLTWLKERKEYLANNREMTARQLKGQIKVDGVIDEQDWKDAEVFSSFTPATWSGEKEKFQKTLVRVAYDADNLYFAVECMEPTPAKMRAGKGLSRRASEFGKLGNRIELFYAYPDMNEKAYHLAINSNGEIKDMLSLSAASYDDTFETKGPWVVKTLDDRWVCEIAIPFGEIGQRAMPGATWKINVVRERMTDGAKGETSSMAGGRVFGNSSFVKVRFRATSAK